MQVINHPENKDVTFSPNGKYLAVAGEDILVRLWEVESWKELSCIKHESQVNLIAFSSDSHYLAAASYDKVAIWAVPSCREISRIAVNSNLFSITFSPDDKYLVIARIDGTIQQWIWQKEDLIDEACRRLTRNLTPEEWEQYFPNEQYSKTCPNLS